MPGKLRDINTTLPLIEHLRELRKRLIISFISLTLGTIICFIFYKSIIEILYRPFEILDSNDGRLLFVNTIFEAFLTKIQVSVLAGMILTFPIHLYNIVKFIFPGLKSKERKVLIFSLGISFVLIIFSAYYSYYNIIPLSIAFLTTSGFIPENVGMLLNFGKNIFYIFQFLFIALVLFQLPILLELLMIMKIVKRKTLFKSSRYVIVATFIITAILTPPDFISQVTLAFPLIVLYFLTILIAKIFKFGEE